MLVFFVFIIQNVIYTFVCDCLCMNAIFVEKGLTKLFRQNMYVECSLMS